MGELEKMRLIVLIGRRWFDKHAGNTYHDVEIIVHGFKGGFVHHRTTMAYGYGDQYIDTAVDWLEKRGLVLLPRYSHGMRKPLRVYCQDHEIELITSVVDVDSRKQLKEE